MIEYCPTCRVNYTEVTTRLLTLNDFEMEVTTRPQTHKTSN